MPANTIPEAKLQEFRKSLEEAQAVMKVLSLSCDTVDEALDVVELALKNDGQLKMVIAAGVAATAAQNPGRR